MVDIKAYLKSHGLRAKDIPKGFVVFNVLGVITYGTTIALCYRYRPIHSLFQHPVGKELMNRIQRSYPQWYSQSITLFDTQATALANSKLVTTTANKLTLDPKKLTMAFTENLIVYKVSLPITIPLNIWLTIRLLSKKDKLKQEGTV